jgi:hypothetical protein
MPFTIDPKLIENDEARLEENASGNLEIVHVPTGTTLEIDSGGAVSTLENTNEEIQDAVGGIVTSGLVYDDAANTISIPQGSGSGLNADTVDGVEAANLGSSVSDSGTSQEDPATTIDFTGNLTASGNGTGTATIALNQGSGSGLNADTVDGIEAANLGSVNEATSEYNLSDDNSNKIFAVEKSSGNLDITGTVTENSSL